MYADGGSASDESNIINIINEDLNNINNWAIMHDVKIIDNF